LTSRNLKHQDFAVVLSPQFLTQKSYAIALPVNGGGVRAADGGGKDIEKAIERGVNWLLAMQCKGGGWGAFDKDNDKNYLTRIPFCDFGEALDPPSVDVTAHIVEAFGKLGFRADHPNVKRAMDYIKNEQEADGSWFGRWGVNYIYGTGAVLPALEAIGEDMSLPYIARACDWLTAKQQADGGWGESCASYMDPGAARPQPRKPPGR